MKVQTSVKPRCKDCKIIRRGKHLFVICKTKRHKQKQG